MTVRVYLPTTTDDLPGALPDAGFVVAEGVDVVVPESDDEESEYAALMTAADASTELARSAGVAGLRRVVVVAELPAVPEPGERVALRDVVALHLDPDDREDDADPDDDLAWFTPDELPHLV